MFDIESDPPWEAVIVGRCFYTFHLHLSGPSFVSSKSLVSLI